MFYILYLIENQIYKLKLARIKKVYNFFYILLLDKNTIRKK